MTSTRQPIDTTPPTMLLSPSPNSQASDEEFDFSVTEPDTACFQHLGRYQLQREIARGGMGVVLHAYDEQLHRDVAIKILRREFVDNLEYHQRFINEALLTSRLQHPSIVPIYDCGTIADGRPFFAMKLMNGQSLTHLLAAAPTEHGDRMRLLKVFEQVCQTLAYTHSRNILHLDLKPANVMVGEFGEVYVMDWGLAQIWEPVARAGPVGNRSMQQRSVTSPDEVSNPAVSGTPAYMAPEQARGNHVSARSDVFGLGALLCEILTGRPPYRGFDANRLYACAIHGRLGEALRGLDECKRDDELISLAKWCLSTKPEDRPADAGQVARGIGDYLETKLRQTESDLYRFFDLTLDLFCIASLDGYFLRVNVNFPQMLGYSEEQLVSRPFVELVHPDDLDRTQAVMSDLWVGKPVVRFRNRYRHAAGHFLWLEWTAQSILHEGTIFAVARIVSGPTDKDSIDNSTLPREDLIN